jgi:N,N'-diacetyllegionaminate synthase
MPKKIRFGSRFIGVGEPVLIIAEIGINHEGDANVCAKMIEEAAKAGVDAVKLQTVDADENYVFGTESHRIFKGAELTREETARMFELARSLGIEPFTTSGDFTTLEWVDKLKPAAHKISSGLLTHIPLIRRTANYQRALLISTGMANVSEIDAAVAEVLKTGNEDVALFQCTSNYPVSADSIHLATIRGMTERWKLPVGFSDHSIGNDAAFLAVGAGAVMLEKHFSLDPAREGFDHHISLNPRALTHMVERVRLAETIMGSNEKQVNSDIDAKRKRFMRCLVARSAVKKGEIFTEDNLSIKRPFPDKRGLEPEEYERVLGKTAARNLEMDDPVTVENVVF